MKKSDLHTDSSSSTESEQAAIDGPENMNRRDALRKLGKYGKVSATVTAVVYTGFQSQSVAAQGLPPLPPLPSFGPGGGNFIGRDKQHLKDKLDS